MKGLFIIPFILLGGQLLVHAQDTLYVYQKNENISKIAINDIDSMIFYDAEYPFSAIVLGLDPDCGLSMIKFTSLLDKVKKIVGTSIVDSIYLAANLPLDLQEEGQTIKLNIREPEFSETWPCNALGPAFTWVYVIKAYDISND